jgi:hypothetical protein
LRGENRHTLQAGSAFDLLLSDPDCPFKIRKKWLVSSCLGSGAAVAFTVFLIQKEEWAGTLAFGFASLVFIASAVQAWVRYRVAR